MWLEQQARRAVDAAVDVPMAWRDDEIEGRHTRAVIVAARVRGIDPHSIARVFHRPAARALAAVLGPLPRASHAKTVVLSGGVSTTGCCSPICTQPSHRAAVSALT